MEQMKEGLSYKMVGATGHSFCGVCVIEDLGDIVEITKVIVG